MNQKSGNSKAPFLGYGLGLRTDHYQAVLDSQPEVDWFEIISENYMVDGGKPLYFLDKIRADYPMVMHGVSMSLGSVEPLDQDYLKRLKKLADRIEPAWFSDHLCWTGVHGINLQDLLPLPYTEEAARHVADRVSRVQDYIGRPMLIENVSSYLTYAVSPMQEWEFLTTIVERADCGILLDINNIYVSAFNHGFKASDYLEYVPRNRVWQFHLAGHQNNGDHIIDTHDHPIINEVWELFCEASRRFGPISTMIERDANIPPLAELLAELDYARELAAPLWSQASA